MKTQFAERSERKLLSELTLDNFWNMERQRKLGLTKKLSRVQFAQQLMSCLALHKFSAH